MTTCTALALGLTSVPGRLIGGWIAQGTPDADGRSWAVPVAARICLRGTMTGEAVGADLLIDSGTRVDHRCRIGDGGDLLTAVRPDSSGRAERFRDR